MAINRPPTDPLYTWVELIYKDAFHRLAIPFEAGYLPLHRASFEANTGGVDGEPARIFEYGASYPNLVRVEESVFSMRVGAYTSDKDMSAYNGWESLKDFAGLVQYPRGMKIVENNLKKVMDSGNLTTITETSQGLRKLSTHRIDIYVDDINSVEPIMDSEEYGLKGKIHMAGILAEVPLYMYIHKKHSALAPQLAAAIKALKEEGLVEQYRKVAFGLSQ